MRRRSPNRGLLYAKQPTGCFQGYADAKRERPTRSAGVSRRKSDQYRTWKIGGERPDRLACRRRAGRLVATAHLAEHQPASPPQHTGQPKLRQHAIDAIGTLVDVLDEQNAPVWRFERVRRSQRCRQLGQGAPEEKPGGFSLLEDRHTFWPKVKAC